MRNRSGWLCTAVLVLAAIPAHAEAGGRFELGVRANALTGDGEPAHDVLGFGAVARWRFGERWSMVFALDHADGFDVEEPARLVGLAPASEVDAKATATMLSAWIERAYPRGRFEGFWSAGFGGGLVDVERVEGPVAGGGSYAIVTSMDGELGVEEVVVGMSGGLRWRLGARSALELALRVERHVADWELVDLRSGATGRVDDYTLSGVTVGWTYRP